MKKCMLGIVGAITAICMLTCTSVFADDDFGGALDGFVKSKDIMSITCDEAETLVGIRNKQTLFTKSSVYETVYPFMHNDTVDDGIRLEDSGDADHGMAMRIVPIDADIGKQYIMGGYSYTTQGNGAVVFSADLMFKDFNGKYRLLEPLMSSGTMSSGTNFNNKIAWTFVVEGSGETGNVQINSKKVKDLAANTWYTFVIVVNMDDGVMTWFIDGEQLASQDFSNQFKPGTPAKINRVRYRGMVPNGTTTEGMYVDNLVTVEYAKRPSISGITVNDANTEVTAVSTAALKVATVTADSVKLYHGDTQLDAAVKATGNNIVITPAAALSTATEYRITIDESVVSTAGLSFAEEDREKTFTTKAASFDVTSVTNDGGTITAKLQNNTGEDKTAIMVVTEKDASGNIVACGFSPETAVGESGATITLSAKNSNATQCEVFFMDNWLSRLLIKKSVFSLSLK